MKFKGLGEGEFDIGYNTINILYVPDPNKIRAMRKRKSFPKLQFRFFINTAGGYSVFKLPSSQRKISSVIEKRVTADIKGGMLFFDVAEKYRLSGLEMQKIIKKYQL